MKLTFGGDTVTILGTQIAVGDVLPSAIVVTKALEEKDIAKDFGTDTIKVISMAPSLDTGTCDLQTKGFISRLSADKDVTLITVSMDLPFAQARWCGAAGAEDAIVVSDYRYHAVADAYGTLIDGLKLLTRVVIVADKDNVVKYVEFVPEIKNQVDFDAALAAIDALR